MRTRRQTSPQCTPPAALQHGDQRVDGRGEVVVVRRRPRGGPGGQPAEVGRERRARAPRRCRVDPREVRQRRLDGGGRRGGALRAAEAQVDAVETDLPAVSRVGVVRLHPPHEIDVLRVRPETPRQALTNDPGGRADGLVGRHRPGAGGGRPREDEVG
jgi:hypothetical protein